MKKEEDRRGWKIKMRMEGVNYRRRGRRGKTGCLKRREGMEDDEDEEDKDGRGM